MMYYTDNQHITYSITFRNIFRPSHTLNVNIVITLGEIGWHNFGPF